MDDDDKIRRNLVVASSAIIAVAWLGVPLPDLVEHLFSLKSSTWTLVLADWGVWAAVLVVLAYLVLRYRWSTEVEEGIAAHDKAAKARYILIYSRDYLPTVTGWIQDRRLTDDIAPGLRQVLSPIIDSELSRRLGGPKKVHWQRLHVGGIAPAPTDGNTGIPVDLTWSMKERGRACEEANAQFAYRREAPAAVLAASPNLRAHLFAWRDGTLVPAAIAAVAVAITLWKL